jgi:hypothetical protein
MAANSGLIMLTIALSTAVTSLVLSARSARRAVPVAGR